MDANKAKKRNSTVDVADQIVSDTDEQRLSEHTAALEEKSKSAAARAARVVEEVVTRKPELAIPHIDRLVKLLTSDHARVVQTCANSLPLLAQVAPAKVAKHLKKLIGSFDSASEVGKDGMVRTFAALCVASIAYQKRVIDVLDKALSNADGKTLHRWAELLLPALKGEPHAQARAVVESRLEDIPRPIAQKIAAFLGVKLRPLYR